MQQIENRAGGVGDERVVPGVHGDGGELALEVFLAHSRECHVCGSSAALCPEGEILVLRRRRLTELMEGPPRRNEPAGG